MVGSIGKYAVSTVAGAGIALAVTWSGGADLVEVQNKAEEIKNLTAEIVQEYEAVISDKQIEIQDIKGMYYEMEEKYSELEVQYKELEKVTEELNAGYVHSLAKNGKYEAELEKANSDAKVHKEEMLDILGETQAILEGGTN